MDPAVLQAAQRVMAWRLEHTVLPMPASPASDTDEDEWPASPADGAPPEDSAAAADPYTA